MRSQTGWSWRERNISSKNYYYYYKSLTLGGMFFLGTAFIQKMSFWMLVTAHGVVMRWCWSNKNVKQRWSSLQSTSSNGFLEASSSFRIKDIYQKFRVRKTHIVSTQHIVLLTHHHANPHKKTLTLHRMSPFRWNSVRMHKKCYIFVGINGNSFILFIK